MHTEAAAPRAAHTRKVPGTLTHVGLGAGHGRSLFCPFHERGDVEVRDVDVSWDRERETRLAGAAGGGALPV